MRTCPRRQRVRERVVGVRAAARARVLRGAAPCAGARRRAVAPALGPHRAARAAAGRYRRPGTYKHTVLLYN